MKLQAPENMPQDSRFQSFSYKDILHEDTLKNKNNVRSFTKASVLKML